MREEGKMIGVIADSLDSRQYDITLAMKKAANIEDEEINNLNSNVRLIYREGSFSCKDGGIYRYPVSAEKFSRL